MNLLIILFFMFMADHVTDGTDPSSCQRAIKYMLISACGVTKREFSRLPQYKVMDKDEIDKLYDKMVGEHMIKGVVRKANSVSAQHTNQLDDSDEHSSDPLLYSRFRRNVMGLKDRFFADPINHEKKGSFYFVGRLPDGGDRSPPPGVLKAKCCGGPYLCTMDDFKGFCG